MPESPPFGTDGLKLLLDGEDGHPGSRGENVPTVCYLPVPHDKLQVPLQLGRGFKLAVLVNHSFAPAQQTP